MRDNYKRLTATGAVIVAVSQDDTEDVNEYWTENKIPFMCLPDPDGKLKKMYHQQSTLGPLPAVFIVNSDGKIIMAHYGTGMSDIPTISQMLKKLPRVRLVL